MTLDLILTIIFWLFFAAIVFVFIKDNVFVELAKGTRDFFVMLWNAMVHGIEDKDAYDANREQREKDEEYKRQLKEKNKDK
jgi:hypothetical protein